jgi:hypothetical protein
MNNNKMSLNNPIMKSFSKQLSSAGQILTLIFMCVIVLIMTLVQHRIEILRASAWP